jgi:2-phospho-L-lactate/phosphoenolpyruvate guanylyltransferase
MSTWAIIPVKPLNRAKSRLSDALTPEQRQHLAEMMFRHVLQVIREVPEVIGTLVVSRDTKALAIAREYRARTVQESGQPELNAALTRATQVVIGWRGDAVLVLPADLPLITPEDVSKIVGLSTDIPSVVIATDQHRDGTNALLVRPPGVIDYAFGVGSFARHIALAEKAGAVVQEFKSDRLALDIDMPADLDNYNHLVRGVDYEPSK